MKPKHSRTAGSKNKFMENLNKNSAVQILKLIASKQISSREVTQFFIDRIEAVNSQLNAVVLKFYDEALKKADAADAALAKGETPGKLHGLPFTIKECFDYLGSPSTLGVLARKNDKPGENDAYIEALMREGGIVLGKTNVPQLLIFIESVNRVYGKTNNPINPNFTCGGSSGGEGAIIGAGASPVGIGSDIGGSVRFPAAFCGICSIKPTMWRTPDLTRYGDYRLEGSIGSVAGVLGNYAEDLDLFLRIINETASKMREVEPFRDYKHVDPAKLKVGYFLSDGIFEPMTAVKRGVSEAVEKLRSLGAEVVEFEPPKTFYAEEIFTRILAADDAKLFTKILDGEKPMPQLKNMFMLAQASPFKRKAINSAVKFFGQKSAARLIPYFGGSGAEHLREWAEKQAFYRAEFLAAMDRENIDALIGPAAALPAFLHDSYDKVGLGGTYTLLYNVLGFPAGIARISEVRKEEAVGRRAGVDLRERTAAKTESMAEGLPLAVQIAARPWREDIVLALIESLHTRKQ
jgi:fatty acid amide hydrolase